MLKTLKSLRTNENILIAVDALLHSKSLFLSTFLMTYMIRISVTDSPDSFVIFKLVSYILMGVSTIFLLHFIRRHPLAAWRIGTFSAILQIIAVITLHSYTDIFPFILALINGVEATLYWRPNIFFSITEVRNDRRLRFESLKRIISAVIKVISPLVLALFITNAGYIQTSFVIIVISLVQFFITILFRPTHEVATRPHQLRAIWHQFIRHKTLRRRVLLLQFLRGFLISGSAYMLIPIILVYNNSGSDLDLGLYTSAGILLSIAIILIYKQISHSLHRVRLLTSLVMPPAVIIPLALIFHPSLLLVIAFYIFTVAVIEDFANVITSVRTMNTIKKHLDGDSYLLEVESIGEVALCAGRSISLVAFLVLITLTGSAYLPHFAAICSLAVIPLAIIALPSPRKM